jgi:hypothetical protein
MAALLITFRVIFWLDDNIALNLTVFGWMTVTVRLIIQYHPEYLLSYVFTVTTIIASGWMTTYVTFVFSSGWITISLSFLAFSVHIWLDDDIVIIWTNDDCVIWMNDDGVIWITRTRCKAWLSSG